MEHYVGLDVSLKMGNRPDRLTPVKITQPPFGNAPG
jgi:hypothetical protein